LREWGINSRLPMKSVVMIFESTRDYSVMSLMPFEPGALFIASRLRLQKEADL